MTEGQLALEATGLWKYFGSAAALEDASLRLRTGSVHALLGENGAGKSTLIKAITGVHRADRGEVRLNGVPVQFERPQEAIAAGISAVYQERNVVPEFSVSENLFLGRPRLWHGMVDYRAMSRDAVPWLRRVGLDIDPAERAGDLSVAQGQLLEIARALTLQSRVLLLDEPTASITDREAANLFDIVRGLKDQGTAILFVSHKLEEIFAICDQVTVLRDGATVLDSAPIQDLTQQSVITAMVGRSVTLTSKKLTRDGDFQEADARRADAAGEVALELTGVSTSFGHRGIDLQVPRGRIVGLYGLVGAGRTELAKSVMGIGSITGGAMRVAGRSVSVRNPQDAIHRYRIGYVSEDRKGEGLILEHSVGRNLGVTIWDSIKRWLGYIDERRQQRDIGPVLTRMDVKYSSPMQSVGQLSGGNQQKVSVGKWLVSGVDVLIVDEPTIGVDVRTKEDMYALMEELASKDVAILLISSDLAEIVRLSDEIYVMAGLSLVDRMLNDGDYSALSERIMHAIVEVSNRPHSELSIA